MVCVRSIQKVLLYGNQAENCFAPTEFGEAHTNLPSAPGVWHRKIYEQR